MTPKPTLPNVSGTIFSQHIEAPQKAFFVRIKMAPCYNVIFRPERWETKRVLGETPEGALAISRYHYPRASRFHMLPNPAEQN